jgi:hypothetical protein
MNFWPGFLFGGIMIVFEDGEILTKEQIEILKTIFNIPDMNFRFDVDYNHDPGLIMISFAKKEVEKCHE